MCASQTCAQVLLSLGNLANRGQYLNASNTFTELFNYGTVPVVNENDTVAVEELRIGDNDTLSAQVLFLPCCSPYSKISWLLVCMHNASLFRAISFLSMCWLQPGSDAGPCRLAIPAD